MTDPPKSLAMDNEKILAISLVASIALFVIYVTVLHRVMVPT